MANVKISELSAATAPTGAETVELVQGGTNKKATVDQVRGIKFARVPVSSAEILALFTTPKLLIAAPGAGKLILPINSLVYYTFVSEFYTADNSIVMQWGIIPGSGIQIGGGADFSGLLTNDEDALNIAYVFGTTNAAAGAVENTGIYLVSNTVDPTDGDGTLLIDIMYRIVDLP